MKGVVRSLCVGGALVTVGLACVPREAFADAPARSAAIGDAEVTRRIAFLEARLGRDERAGRTWWTVWFVTYATLAVGQGAIAIATTDPGLRADMAVGAAFSPIGNLGLALFPIGFKSPVSRLTRYPERTQAERRYKLSLLEHRLDETAREEALGRSWLSHVAGAAVSLASGLVLAIGYDRVESGAVNVVSGIAVAELQIWTQPVIARDAAREYGRPVSQVGRPGLVFSF